MSGNPVFEGWYADPEGIVFGDRTGSILPTRLRYHEQLFFDCFSSPDLVTLDQTLAHARNAEEVKWAESACGAPRSLRRTASISSSSAPTISRTTKQRRRHRCGRRRQAGRDPIKDHLGKPLVGKIHNGAHADRPVRVQGADGAGLPGLRRLGALQHRQAQAGLHRAGPFRRTGSPSRRSLRRTTSKGPCMFIRDAKCYFMWSEGAGPARTTRVRLRHRGLSPRPVQTHRKGSAAGPLRSPPAPATTSVIHVPGTDEWYTVYHRRPLGETDGNHRVTCIDRMEFDEDGLIKPIRITHEGVPARPLE